MQNLGCMLSETGCPGFVTPVTVDCRMSRRVMPLQSASTASCKAWLTGCARSSPQSPALPRICSASKTLKLVRSWTHLKAADAATLHVHQRG